MNEKHQEINNNKNNYTDMMRYPSYIIISIRRNTKEKDAMDEIFIWIVADKTVNYIYRSSFGVLPVNFVKILLK